MSNERHIEVLNVMYGILDGLAQGHGVSKSGAQDLLPAALTAIDAAKEALAAVQEQGRAIDNLHRLVAMTERRAGILEEMRVESLRETFDPQAVRELLVELAKDSHTVGSWHFVKEAAERVSESEKK